MKGLSLFEEKEYVLVLCQAIIPVSLAAEFAKQVVWALIESSFLAYKTIDLS